MKTMAYTDSRGMAGNDMVLVRPLKPATSLRRFQRYIETSDWDEQIIRMEPFLNKICLIAVILSGLILSPLLLAATLK